MLYKFGVLTLLSVFIAPFNIAFAEHYLSEYCWRVDYTHSPVTWELQLGVSLVGDGHFDIRGTGIRSDGVVESYKGSAEARPDGNVIMVLYTAGKRSDAVWSGSIRATLGDGLNGTHKDLMIIRSDNSDNPVFVEYTEGSIVSINCS